MGGDRTFRCDKTKGSIGKRSADRAPDKRDLGIQVSREAQRENGSLTE